MSNPKRPRAKIAVGDLYEDCNYYIVRCEEVDNDGDGVSGVSLLDGSRPRSCSIYHCGVRKVTEEEAKLVASIYLVGGEKALMKHHGWTEEQIEKFYKDWR